MISEFFHAKITIKDGTSALHGDRLYWGPRCTAMARNERSFRYVGRKAEWSKCRYVRRKPASREQECLVLLTQPDVILDSFIYMG